MKTKMRHAIWWAVTILLLVPALLLGFAFDCVKRVAAVLDDWWDDFYDWAHPEEGP